MAIRSSRKGKAGFLKYVPVIAVFVVIGIAAYFAHSYYASGSPLSPASGLFASNSATPKDVVCEPSDPSDCRWNGHLHAMVITSVDGRMVKLPEESGNLEGMHTHGEENILHWHGSLPYDMERNVLQDKTPLLLSSALRAVKFEAPDGALMFLKRNNTWSQFGDYSDIALEDNDVVYVEKGNRTADQVMSYLKTTSYQLPPFLSG